MRRWAITHASSLSRNPGLCKSLIGGTFSVRQQTGKAREVAGMSEGQMREDAVAELRIDRTTSGAIWAITSRDRLVDEAIAEALPARRRDGPPGSCGLVRTVLADEVEIRVEDPASLVDGLARLEGTGQQCLCRESGEVMRNGNRECLCGCHFGMICREAIIRMGRREAPQVECLFTFLSAPAVGPIFMRQASWGLCLWLRKITRDSRLRDGPLEMRLRLQRSVTRTRSGIEVAVAQPTVQILRYGASVASYQLAI